MPPSYAGTIEASHFSPDTLEFIRLLGTHEVEYVMVGGEAVIYFGHARFTGDVDFFYSNREDNVKKLFGTLKEFWSGSIPGVASPDELAEPGVVVQFGRPPNRIDLMNRIDGVEFEESWNAKLVLCIANSNPTISLFILSLDNLIRNKRAAGRPKDLEDLKFLERAAGSDSLSSSG